MLLSLLSSIAKAICGDGTKGSNRADITACAMVDDDCRMILLRCSSLPLVFGDSYSCVVMEVEGGDGEVIIIGR